MTNTNNPIEFLLNLGINTPASKTNIKQAIANVQNQLDTNLDVNLVVKNNNSATAMLNNMNRELDKVRKSGLSLAEQLGNIGGRDTGNGFRTVKIQTDMTIKSLEYLRLKSLETNASLDFKYSGTNLDKYKSAVLTLTNSMGELERVTYKALYSNKGDLTGFKAVETATKNTDFDKFNKQQKKAIDLLTEFEKQGKISTQEIRRFKEAINSATDNKALKATVEDMKRLNVEMGRQIKHSTINQINQDAKSLHANITQLARSNGLSTTSKEFQDLINKAKILATTKVFNDQDLKNATAEMRIVNSEFNKLAGQAGKFGNLNSKIMKLVHDLERVGTVDTTTLVHMVDDIQRIGRSSDTTEGKLKELRRTLMQLNEISNQTAHNNAMSKAMIKAKGDVEKLQIQLLRVEQQWKKTVNKEDVARLRGELSSLVVPNFSNQLQADQFAQQISGLGRRLQTINAQATQSARSSMSVLDSFKVALERFPIWMASSTLFFGAIRGVRDLTEQVIELDSHMTTLKRVMDEPDYKFNEMLEQQISNVEALSSKLPDMMKLVEEYGRMGFEPDQVIDMANTSAMLANISDLDASESVDALVASMIAFNIEGENSIRIADALNEVDNNFSVTTKNLALSLNKASSTAKTFGVTLEEMIGHVTSENYINIITLLHIVIYVE